MVQWRIHKTGIIISLIILGLVLIGGVVTALDAGDRYSVKTIEQCVGQIQVKARTNQPSNGSEYKFLGCVYNGTYWFCDCGNPSTVIFLTDNGTTNQYDIVLEWYEKPYDNNIEQDEFRNTQWFMNIDVGPKPIPKKIFKMPKLEGVGLILTIVGGIIFFIGIMIMIVLKMLLSDDSNKIDDKPKRAPIEKKEVVEEVDDEEFQKALREYTK